MGKSELFSACGHYAPDGRAWRGRGRPCFEFLPTMHEITLAQACEFALDTYAPAGRHG